ncbi:MarC family protein [Dongshaea marina]|uniref:MarC family protein n=1 Tax=Dongshaea marina TaxID=2047966 RepID=UPI000D3EC0D8|nr:MarC family protein [Dongshaea marina]
MSGIAVMLDAFSKVATIANPISMMAIFISFASAWPKPTQKRCASKTCLIVAIILVVTSYFGSTIMTLFGIDLPSLEIGGGICLLLSSLSLMKHSATDQENHDQRSDQLAVVPLAMPIIAGPAVIASVILSVEHHGALLINKSWVALACILFSLVLWLFFYYSEYLARWLGARILTIVTQITALILISMAAKIIMTGLKQSMLL